MLYSYSEIERLLRDGMIYVEFTYAWHSPLSCKSLIIRHAAEVKMVDDCLKHGGNPSNRGGPGVTALMLACKNVNYVWEYSVPVVEWVVTLLLEHGAEVNQQDFYGRTALHYVFESSIGNYLFPSEKRLAQKQRVVKILIQRNADIYLKDSCGLSAIDMAKRQGHESWLRTDEASLTETRSKKGKTSCSIS
jgi:hypothetical protein